jgi:hypothetical protein
MLELRLPSLRYPLTCRRVGKPLLEFLQLGLVAFGPDNGAAQARDDRRHEDDAQTERERRHHQPDPDRRDR